MKQRLASRGLGVRMLGKKEEKRCFEVVVVVWLVFTFDHEQ